MKSKKIRAKNEEQPKIDPRILGQILAAQNVDFVLPDTAHVAEFYAETLTTMPGVIACAVCLGDVTAQKGSIGGDLCHGCLASRQQAVKGAALQNLDLDFTCRLTNQPEIQFITIKSLRHNFGFLVFHIGDRQVFEVYRPFIGNLANYLALSLENRLQSELLKHARDELELRVEERTQDLLATNLRLQEEIEHRRRLGDALKASERQALSLLNLSKNLETAETYLDVMDAARLEVNQIIGFSNLSFYLLSTDKKYFRPLAIDGVISGVEGITANFIELQVAGDKMLETVIATGEMLIIEDARMDDRPNMELTEQFGYRTVVCIPVTLFGNHLGLIITGTFAKEGVKLPSHTELEYLRELASQVVVTLDRINLHIERRRAEESLRLSEEKFRTLIEQASDGIFLSDAQGNYLDVNPSGCKMLGYAREEILSMNMKDLISPVDLVKTPIRFRELSMGKHFLSEREMVTKSGALITVEISGGALDNGNLLGLVRDITERKRHELEREAIISVADAMRSTSTRTELVSRFLNQIKDLFMAAGVMLSITDKTTGEATFEMGCGPIGEQFTGLQLSACEGIRYLVTTNGKPYFTNQARNDPNCIRSDLLGEAQTVACVPLIAQEQVIGALWIVRSLEITISDISLLVAIANLAANAIHRVTLFEQKEQQLQQLAALHQIDTAILADFDLRNVISVLLNNLISQLQVDAADVLLLSPDNQWLEYAAGAGFRTRNIELTHVAMGEGLAGAAALEGRIFSLHDLRLAKDKFSRAELLSDEEFIAYITAPLNAKGAVKGVLEVYARKQLDPGPEWFGFFTSLATQAAIAIENANLFSELQSSNRQLMYAYEATIEGWALALDLRDKETEGHTRRVTEMTIRLAKAMGVSDDNIVNLRRGAILHDIGKMGLPDHILFNPGALTEEEWVVIRKHPTYAYEMLSPIRYLRPAIDIPYCHHEKWDGSGYPRGLKGEEIPLAARIFAVIDVWDALRANRRYRAAWEEDRVLAYICEQSGKHFDPEIVTTFLKVQPWKEAVNQA